MQFSLFFYFILNCPLQFAPTQSGYPQGHQTVFKSTTPNLMCTGARNTCCHTHTQIAWTTVSCRVSPLMTFH